MTFDEKIKGIEMQMKSAFRVEEVLSEMEGDFDISFENDRIIVESDNTDKKLHLISLRVNPDIIRSSGKLKATVSEISIVHSDGSIEELPINGVIDVEMTID